MKYLISSKLQLRLQSWIFTILLLTLMAFAAWFSTQYRFSFDLSANQRNSLSDSSLRLIANIDQPMKITSFISPVNENRETLTRLFDRYSQQQPNITFETINPDLAPQQLREFNIEFDGETLIQYSNRSETLRQITESTITNAMQRLMRQGERWIAFLQGHGERNPFGQANHDISLFASQLGSKGFHVEQLLFNETSRIPVNTNVLVIASPQSDLLPGEVDLVQQYIEAGGNLLWLTEPDDKSHQGSLADSLLLEFLPGTIIDPNSQLLGLKRMDFVLVADFPMHDITRNLQSLTLFPQAQGIEFYGDGQIWQQQVLLQSNSRSWNETGEVTGEVLYGDNDDEHAGPLNIGISLARSIQADDGKLSEQRIVVSGDGDFLSNRYLGNGSNTELGLNMINWLSHDDDLIAIHPKSAPDIRLDLSQNAQFIIGFGFLLFLPAGLLLAGVRIWLVRRKK